MDDANDSNLDSLLSGSRKHEKDFLSSFSRIDLQKLWILCGRQCEQSACFEESVRAVVEHYRPQAVRLARLPAKERNPIYNRLDKAVSALLSELYDLPEVIQLEITNSAEESTPENVSEIVSGRFEGLSYGEYQVYSLEESLSKFHDIIKDAHKVHGIPRGKPKQNENLTETILGLGEIFKRYSGEDPMSSYSYDELDDREPYKSRFFDFLRIVLWSFNGRDFPSGHAIGDAARRAFGLKK